MSPDKGQNILVGASSHPRLSVNNLNKWPAIESSLAVGHIKL
jgi:hypothetical protein